MKAKDKRYCVESVCRDTQDRQNAGRVRSSWGHTRTQRTHNTRLRDASFWKKRKEGKGEGRRRKKGKKGMFSLKRGRILTSTTKAAAERMEQAEAEESELKKKEQRRAGGIAGFIDTIKTKD